MAELLAMDLLHGFIEAGQQLDALRSDLRQDDAAVFALAAAGYQSALGQAVEQTRNVGISRNHAGGNFAAGKSAGRAAQDAKHVVLCRREVLALEQLRRGAREQV